MGKELDTLLQRAKKSKVTPAEQEAQRRSFAFGNTRIENDRITMEIVTKAAEEMLEPSASGGNEKD